MATDQPAGATAWITVSPDTDPLVDAHLAHAGGTVVGETWSGDDWREALAWARARTDQVYIRFDFTETTWWAGAGPPPQGGDRPVQPLPDRPTVFVDDWIAELLALRRRLAELEAAGKGTTRAWTMYSPPGTGRSARFGSVPASCTGSPRSGRRRPAVRSSGVEDPEGNRALLLQGRPDPHPARSRYRG
jgi:hypothetical protein